ncbi:hypothetical protein GCM10017608_05660 [Agromyces luteolus]|uniref:Signal transduction histidine kinase subgroup 3 dimerisation and phosphoacceptor domain-containing protein n=1 Tax=Agromyces luteolus TaxID=88373 RepID=A0A7C9LXU8_9MICO|nr:histidine kinase [Agromyces luteolus]MUN06333.1 hypothetical protein [Agromyces luteolus]GLK26634.1 hypothetical protein GCM10017608_05660 [Agromyces luteolus]
MTARSGVRDPWDGPRTDPSDDASPRRAPAASGLIAAAVASAVAATAATGVLLYAMRSDRLVAREPLVAWAESLAIALLVGGAWLSARRPVLAGACAVATVGIGVPVLAGASVAPAVATTVGIGLAPLTVAAAAVVTMEYAGLGGRSVRAVLWGVASAAAAFIVITVDPIDEASCLRRCPDVAGPMSGLVGSDVAVAFGAIASLLCVAIAAGAVARGRRGLTGAAGPAVIAAVTAGAVMAVGQVVRAASWGHIGAWPWGAAALAAGAGLLGATVVAERLDRIRTTADVRRLAQRLRVRGAGRAVFPSLDEPGWLDGDGSSVDDVSGFRTEVSDDLGVIARLALGRRDRSLRAADLDPADLLAIRNARMTASALARVRWLEESRRLVIASTERERERVEHDLHDGAQQRLVSALLFLAVARRQLGDSGALSEAESQIRTALERLRALSHRPRPHDREDGPST